MTGENGRQNVPAPEPEREAAREVANALWNLIEAHEADCEDPACRFRSNLVSYIGHVVGLRADRHAAEVESIMRRYEAGCPLCAKGVEHGREAF